MFDPLTHEIRLRGGIRKGQRNFFFDGLKGAEERRDKGFLVISGVWKRLERNPFPLEGSGEFAVGAKVKGPCRRF
jgi:hypothetical protein